MKHTLYSLSLILGTLTILSFFTYSQAGFVPVVNNGGMVNTTSPTNNGGVVNSTNSTITTSPTNNGGVVNTNTQPTNTAPANNGGLVNPSSNQTTLQNTQQGGSNLNPFVAGPQNPTPGVVAGQQNTNSSSSSGVGKITNPVTGIKDLPTFVSKVLGIILKIAIPVVAAFIIYSGLMFVLARGNTEKIEHAKQRFLYTLIGAGILLGAWMIAEVIKATIEALMA